MYHGPLLAAERRCKWNALRTRTEGEALAARKSERACVLDSKCGRRGQAESTGPRNDDMLRLMHTRFRRPY